MSHFSLLYVPVLAPYRDEDSLILRQQAVLSLNLILQFCEINQLISPPYIDNGKTTCRFVSSNDRRYMIRI